MIEKESNPILDEQHGAKEELQENNKAERADSDNKFDNTILERISTGDLSEEEFGGVLRLTDGVWSGEYALDEEEYGNRGVSAMSLALARVVGEEEEWRQGLKSKRTQDARKLFLAGFLEKMQETEDEEKADSICDDLFSAYSHPDNLINHVGGFLDYAELYELAKESKSGSKDFAGLIRLKLKEDKSFRDGSMVRELFALEPIELARMIPIVIDVAEDAGWMSTWEGSGVEDRVAEEARGTLTKTYETLAEIRDNNSSAFLRIEAQAMAEDLRRYENGLSVNRSDWSDEQKEAGRLRIERWVAEDREWRKLNEKLDESELEYKQKLFLKALHRPNVKNIVEGELGVGLDDISVEGQERLLGFMAKAGDNTYERLKGAMTQVDNKKGFAEAFLAMEFGEDFGEVLLNVAEVLDKEDLSKLLTGIENIRNESEDFAAFFGEKLGQDVEWAIGERVSEILYVAKEVQEKGIAEAELLGNRLKTTDINEAINVLAMIGSAIGDINSSVDSGLSKKIFNENGVNMYQLGETGNVLLKTRAYGARNRESMREIEYTGEAQINFAVNVMGFEPVPAELSDEIRDNALSIRIDREGLALDENGEKIDYNPTLEDLTIALDLGALGGADDNPNTMVGKIVAIGNILRSQENQKKGRGYHTTLSAELRPKEAFAQMVQKVEYQAEEMTRLRLEAHLGQSTLKRASLPEEKTAA